MRSAIGASRYLVLLAVISAFAAGTTLLAFGAYETYVEIRHVIEGRMPESLAVTFIELADLFLLGVVLYIIALGLYELFIDDSAPVPAWLEIHHLDDLKNKLISVVIVVMSVLFLKQVVSWDGESNLLTYGGGIGVVIAALTYFLSYKSAKGKE
ncbi:MAG: YqhA family protein [Chloroflexota bacterium]